MQESRAKTLKAQHALVANPYDVVVEMTVEQGAGTSSYVQVEPGRYAESLCIQCQVSLVTALGDGSLVEVRHQIGDGRRYILHRPTDRYVLREVLAK